MAFDELKQLWWSDLYRYTGTKSWRTCFGQLFLRHTDDGFRYSFYLRLCGYLRTAKPKVIMKGLYGISLFVLSHYKYKYGIAISQGTHIGPGLYIGHTNGIVVSDFAEIGKNCNLSQGVTIGVTNRGKNKGTPIIGDNVFIGAGAIIIGAIRVGNHVAIGANCVVTKDVPDNAVVAGVPGRIISYQGSRDYVVWTV